MTRPLPPLRLRVAPKDDLTVPYRCLLGEQPVELLPRPAQAELKKLKLRDDLLLNPYCFLEAADLRSLPFLTNFLDPDEMVWILDADRNALQPFWLPKELKSRLSSLQPAVPVSTADLSPQAAKLLYFAGVLTSPADGERRSREFTRSVSRASAFFQKNRYVKLKNLLHPLHVAALRCYIRDLTAAGKLEKGKGGYKSCHLKHNEPTTRFFHHQLTSLVSEVIGEPVQPSFSFICSYHGGAELARHTDREQCEFTLSLCVDFIPEPASVTSWPLHIETGDGQVTIEQALGDGILFCGRDLAHYRDRLADGCTSTSVLFHFVRRNFDGELD